jgi:hypothetical protein
MTALVPVLCNRTSGADIDAALVPATVADTLPAGPNNYLRVKNASAAPVVVTVTPAAGGQAEGTSLQPFVLTPSVAVTTGDMIYGPFPQNPWGDVNGLVHISYSAFATVTVECLTITTT